MGHGDCEVADLLRPSLAHRLGFFLESLAAEP